MVASTEAHEEKRGRRGIRRKKRVAAVPEAKRPLLHRSSPEPGMENQDVSFMEGLSSRLSAYSIEAEESGQAHEEQEHADADADADAESHSESEY
jgi:hypothetical protein